jgi:hypothetical protein
MRFPGTFRRVVYNVMLIVIVAACLAVIFIGIIAFWPEELAPLR